MKLNKLSYRILEPNDQTIDEDYFVDYEDSLMPSFELLIDGKSVSSLLEASNKAIPYYYFENNDLPSYFHNYRNKEVHIIGVCSCGISSCGSSSCVLEKGRDFVTFKEIYEDGFEFPKDFSFKFSRENYDFVIDEISKMAKEYKEKVENKNS